MNMERKYRLPPSRIMDGFLIAGAMIWRTVTNPGILTMSGDQTVTAVFKQGIIPFIPPAPVINNSPVPEETPAVTPEFSPEMPFSFPWSDCDGRGCGFPGNFPD
jgi:hypothetical protein